MVNDAKWVDYAAQAIFHTWVAALVLEALVRLWKVKNPRQRMALRLLALGHPLLVLPAFVFLVPVRATEWFRDGQALFAGRRWDELRLGGFGLFHVWLGAFVALGGALFLMDLVPLLLGRRGAFLRSDGQGTSDLGRAAACPPPRRETSPRPSGRDRLELERELERLALAMGMARPPVVFLEQGGPALFCTGARRPALVVSSAALDLLDEIELRAALAHELAHLDNGDPASSWLLMAGRALQFFNPAFQVVARALARDAEWRADERAAAVTGDRLALASGLLKLYRATEGRPVARGRRNLPLAGALAAPLARARAFDVEARCRRLLDAPAPPLAFGALRLAAAAGALLLLLFFVV